MNIRRRRYPQSASLGSIVDLLQVQEDERWATGDYPNARRIAAARNRVVDVAIGDRRGARGR